MRIRWGYRDDARTKNESARRMPDDRTKLSQQPIVSVYSAPRSGIEKSKTI
jgi:hypothetical protein